MTNMAKKKVLFLTMASFAIATVLNLALVGSVSAAAEEGTDCTTTGNTACETATTGLTCQANPCLNGKTGEGACSADFFTIAGAANARVCCSKLWGCLGETGVKDATGLGSTDPREMAAKVVNVILGFLGIIAVVLILIGGFMWMTSAGSEEKTGTAKKIMSAGVIGLVIVLAAFGIAKFVISAMITATT